MNPLELGRIEEQGREWARRRLAIRPLTEDQKRRIRIRCGLAPTHPPAPAARMPAA